MSSEPEPEFVLKLKLSSVWTIVNHLQTGVYSNVIDVINQIYNQVGEQMPATATAPIPPTNADEDSAFPLQDTRLH